MEPNLSSLIQTVELRSTSPEPLVLLATASASVAVLNDLSDSLLSHYVDRCRHAGHSWAEIGSSLGVTKQAVQQRFRRPAGEPPGWERFTPRTRRVVLDHAPAAGAALGHGWVGTEHLLIGLWGEPECLAVKILERLEVTSDCVLRAVTERVERGEDQDQVQDRTYTPLAWAAISRAGDQALTLGHNYVGTEHLLLSLVGGVGGMAQEVLTDAGAGRDAIQPMLVEILSGFVRSPP